MIHVIMTVVREALPDGSQVPVNIDLVLLNIDRDPGSDTQPLSALYGSLSSRESVIRAISLGSYEQSWAGEYINWSPTSDSETFVDLFSKTRELLDEANDSYGIRNSGFNPFVARDSGEIQGYVHSRRVHGEPIYANGDVSKSIPNEAIDDVASRVALYFTDKYISDEPCLPDLMPNNFIYGKRAGDVEPSMYFIDLDPLFFQIGNAWGLQHLKAKLDFWAYTVSTLDASQQQSRAAFHILLDTLESDGKFGLNIPTWRKTVSYVPEAPAIAS